MPDTNISANPSPAHPFRKSLRNPHVNYRSGLFFVTSQVAHNKSIFGAIVGEKVVHNELGRKAWEYWLGLPVKYPEPEIFQSVLMPNHFLALIQVIPQGIPPESGLSPELAAACREGRALLLSPQPSGSRLNKKVATWCNEYVLRYADEILVGGISPNGMLHAMLRELKGSRP